MRSPAPDVEIGPGSRQRTAPDGAWQWWLEQRNLIVQLPKPYRVVSWAMLGGGYRQADLIVNHQVELHDSRAALNPRVYLRAVIRKLATKALGNRARRRITAMMTGARVGGTGYARAAREPLAVGAWCTAGLSNALRIGDCATVDPGPGTINIIVVLNQSLTQSAMIEALALATEARVVAVQNAGVRSIRSGRPATGTGTDCIVVAAPPDYPPYRYCGKHTVLGELTGKAVLRACTLALRRYLLAR